MEPKISILHSAEASPRAQCSPPHSPEAHLQPPVLRHHSHTKGTEGKELQTSPSFVLRHVPVPSLS